MAKKVSIYYAGFKQRGGGVYFHVMNLQKGLESLGFEVKIITLDNLPIVVRYVPHLVQKVGNVIKFPLGFLYKQRIIKWFFRWFFGNSADINIFEDIYTYWTSNRQSAVWLHALWSDNLQAFSLTEKDRSKLENEETKILNKIQSDVITVSKPYKDFILSRLLPYGLKTKIDVIELGIDVQMFDSKPSHNNNSFIYVGSLEARKNLKFLLYVFADLQEYGNYTLTLVGDGPEKAILEKFVKKHSIQNVTFLGRLTYEEVIFEMRKHQYYIHTSIKESFSYSLLEAKLSGLITIAYSGLEVPKEFIDIKINSFEREEWVRGICQYPKRCKNFNKNDFSYQKMTKRLIERLC